MYFFKIVQEFLALSLSQFDQRHVESVCRSSLDRYASSSRFAAPQHNFSGEELYEQQLPEL
jgi:hypothetical protein